MDHGTQEPTARIDAILAALPSGQRVALQALREIIAAAVPDADEAMPYGVPGFTLDGRPLAGYAASKKHCSYYPMSPGAIDAHREALSGFSLSKGTIRFSPEQPIPPELVTSIVRYRKAQIERAD